MQRLSPDEKAKIYNQMLFQYQRLQEEVRLIKAENMNVSDKDQLKINQIESKMKHIFNQTQRLY
jgi:hypothetical protein